MFSPANKSIRMLLFICAAVPIVFLLILLSAATTVGLLNLTQYMDGPIGTFLTDKGPARIMRRALLIGVIFIFVFSLKKFGWQGWKDCGWIPDKDETCHCRRLAQLGWGAALGFFSLGGIALLTIFTGLHQLKPLNGHYQAIIGNIIFFCLSGILVALVEETICRGILFRVFARIWRAWPAAIIISVLFAAAHFVGPGDAAFQGSSFINTVFNVSVSTFKSTLPPSDSLIRFFNLALLGIVLCVFVMRTKTIWMSVGAHAAWVAIIKTHSSFTDLNPAVVFSIWLGKRNDFMDSLAASLIFIALTLLTIFWKKNAGQPIKIRGAVWHIRSDQSALDNFLKSGGNLFTGGNILKTYRGCHIVVKDGLVLKKYRPKSFLNSLRFAFRPPRSRRAFLLADTLINRSLPTPPVLAWSAERRFGLLISESMIVSEVKNAEPLTDWLATRSAWQASNPVNTGEGLKVQHPAKPESVVASHAAATLSTEAESHSASWRRRVMEAYGNLMAAFHCRGYSNRDLKHENVMCSKEKPWILWVVDLDGVRKHLLVTRRRAGKDLMRVGKSLASLGWTNEAEINAFFEAYNSKVPARLRRHSFPGH